MAGFLAREEHELQAHDDKQALDDPEEHPNIVAPSTQPSATASQVSSE
jgi:hypothetical protein